MHDSYSIYRIVCFPTGKVYVGKSFDPDGRIRKHFSDLKRGKHINKHLQNAFDKHGCNCFYGETIEKGIRELEINEREIYWIGYYDSLINGFNAIPGGINPPINNRPCQWNSIEYQSIREAALANNVNEAVMSQRIKKGYVSDSDIQNGGKPRKSCNWNGIAYRSVSEAAKDCGVNITTMLERLEKGYVCDKDVTQYERPCTWNGVEYPSVALAAVANNIDKGSMWYRVNQGHHSDADVDAQRNNKQCAWNGINYCSIAQAAKANNITTASMWSRIKKGYTGDFDMPGRWVKQNPAN